MMKRVRTSEICLFMGLSLILLFMLFHDWVPLGSLNNVEAIKELRSKNELIVVTLIGVFQILLLMTFVLSYIGRTYPLWVKLWLIIHQGFILCGALLDWWIPYFFGVGAESRVERYNAMFGNTHAFLPVKNGIVPNTIHVLFHLTLLICLLITIYISITSSRERTVASLCSDDI